MPRIHVELEGDLVPGQDRQGPGLLDAIMILVIAIISGHALAYAAHQKAGLLVEKQLGVLVSWMGDIDTDYGAAVDRALSECRESGIGLRHSQQCQTTEI